MTERKWTSGPWRVNKYGSVGAGELGTLPIVAEIQPFYGADLQFGSHAANARLVAAAPELYDCLETLVSKIRDGGLSADLTGTPVLMMALAALAKARGEP